MLMVFHYYADAAVVGCGLLARWRASARSGDFNKQVVAAAYN
jgi:hypothetical protein